MSNKLLSRKRRFESHINDAATKQQRNQEEIYYLIFVSKYLFYSTFAWQWPIDATVYAFSALSMLLMQP